MILCHTYIYIYIFLNLFLLLLKLKSTFQSQALKGTLIRDALEVGKKNTEGAICCRAVIIQSVLWSYGFAIFLKGFWKVVNTVHV